MNTKNAILVTAIAAVFLVAMVGSASADEQITSLPFTTNEDGERYYLEGYLTCTNTSTAGITIAHNNVIIDGQGHKITGSASAAACSDATQTSPAAHSGIRKSADVKNTMIEDIEIVGFCTGIGIEGTYTYTGDEYNTEVTGCKIHDNGNANSITHGVHLTGANNCTITKNEIYNQDGTADMGSCGDGGNGISMHGVVDAGGNYNTITCNYLHDNAKCGLHAKFKCMYNTISYNNVTGNAGAGIMPECKKSDWNTFKYNYIKDNGPYYGFYTRGNNNVIRYNTIINTKGANGHYYGIYIGTAGAPTPYGRYNNIANNTVCGSQAEDIIITGGAADTNTVNNNTCDVSSGGTGNGCPWNCDSLTTVYYDFDKDGYYSKDPADCACSIVGGGQCACCNPGLFNGSDDAKASYEASCNCQWTVGDDPNDCNASITGAEAIIFDKELVEGWNLVSLPLIPSDKQVSSVLNSIDEKYDAVVRYNAATHQFVTLSVSDEMDNGIGYFIHMTVNGTWSYQGTAYESTNVGLSQGLNCVGWTNTSANLPGALNSIAGSYKYVARWNAASQSYEAYEPNAPPPFNDFTTMNRGDGYWIATKGSCTLTYP